MIHYSITPQVESVNGSTLKSKEFRSALNDIFDKYEDIKDEAF